MRIKSTTLNKVKQYLYEHWRNFLEEFTLIEVMIMIVIVAILNSVIVDLMK